MPAPLVSVLIPCFNAAPWIGETLHSALAQTWRRLEVIVIDDGSTDSSLEIARSFSDPRIQVISQSNGGQCAANNHALRLAQGDYFEYLDADDLLHPEKIESQIAQLQSYDPGWVASGAWARFSRQASEAKFEREAIWQDLDPVSWLVSSWSGGGMMHGAAWLVPRDIAHRAGPFAEDLTLVNDFDYFSRVLLQSTGVKFCGEAKTYYRSEIQGSLSAQKSSRAWKSAFDSFTRGTGNLLARENSERTRQAAAITFQSFAYSAYPLVPDLIAQAEQRVAELGGCDRSLRSGALFNLIVSVFGWKAARRIQTAWHGWKRNTP